VNRWLAIIRFPIFPFVSMGSVYLNTSNRHSSRPLWDAGLRRNWRIDKK
jgi:hypothetical protein